MFIVMPTLHHTVIVCREPNPAVGDIHMNLVGEVD